MGTEKPLKILMLAKRFAEAMPKHQHKFDMLEAIGRVADVRYWTKDGDIFDIMARLDFRPDMIFHYDFEWRNAFAPNIRNLDRADILKGCYVLDVHFDPAARREYFDRSGKPDIIFSASKYPFLEAFPDCASRFEWLPFGINESLIKDYGLPKDIRYSLMGLMDPKYPFRHAVASRMKGAEGFVHFKHPGHRTPDRPGLFVKEEYARAINRSMISFTCGSVLRIPVAKFLEIPGCRALMLAEPNRDIEELGFEDGVHYVACNRTNVGTQALYYAEAAEEREQLTDAGYELVHRAHTNEARARQFVDAVKARLTGGGRAGERAT
ncbi:glycosyltransferase family protein [Paenibacillus soyae]|uniref:Glycosyltransferase n=1 Tax=Paenibacillus soyae TaxID=2969249 RepID=A0A9X2S8Q4_9BACL|nr:glycosyltransferase [Paenibacillus soyae]